MVFNSYIQFLESKIQQSKRSLTLANTSILESLGFFGALDINAIRSPLGKYSSVGMHQMKTSKRRYDCEQDSLKEELEEIDETEA